MTATMKVGLLLIGVVAVGGIVFIAATSRSDSASANTGGGGFTPTATTPTGTASDAGVDSEAMAVREGFRTAGTIGTAIINLVTERENRSERERREAADRAERREERTFCASNPNAASCGGQRPNGGAAPARAGT